MLKFVPKHTNYKAEAGLESGMQEPQSKGKTRNKGEHSMRDDGQRNKELQATETI